MKILLTGANGFLGRAVVESLVAAGERDLRLFLRPASPRPQREGIEVVEGTLLRIADIERALDGVQFVYHLAAAKNGAVSDIFLHTVVGTKNLLEACIRRPEPPALLLVSSMSVYASASLPRGAKIDEQSPTETNPELRDAYAFSKARQETLFHEYCERHRLRGVVARPGVIYGPGGVPLPSRVGLTLPGIVLHLGGDNQLPLTYVENCADALARIGQSPHALGQIYNIVDDDLPSCRQYLGRYHREARSVRSLALPWPATLVLSHLNEIYSKRSKGQLPAILTPYKSRALWSGNRFDNRKLKSLGWTPRISTEEGLRRTFASIKSEPEKRLGS